MTQSTGPAVNTGGFASLQVATRDDADSLIADTRADQSKLPSKPAMGSTSRVVGGVVSATSRGGSVVYDSKPAISTSDSAPVKADSNESIVTSIRSMHGRLLSGSDVRPDSIITLREGFETSVAAALAAGFITKEGQGYREVGHTPGQPKATPTPQQAPAETPAEAIEPLDAEAETIISTAMTQVGAVELSAGVNSVVDAGSLSPDVAARIAARTGETPAQVTEKAERLRASFTTQATTTVGSERVFEWARVSKPTELRAAILSQVNDGSTAGLKALASSHMQSLPTIDPAAILSSPDAKARGVRQEKDGTISVNIPGVGRMGWREAVRGKFIAPAFAKRSA